MESSAALGSLHQTLGSAINSESKLHLLSGNWSASGSSCVPRWGCNRKYTLVIGAKASNSPTTTKSDDSSDARVSNGKSAVRRTTFPKEVEALVHEMCDETEVAVLQLKVGDFEMNLKRKIGGAVNPSPVADISPTVAPPIPSEPMNKSGSAAPNPSKTKPVSEKVSPFMNSSYGKSSKLVALESAGINNYVLVKSPSVGKFQRSRTVKGKKQAPSCKEGDTVKEDQVIGYLNQLGKELPVTSDVAGEILKILPDDEDNVGYGDPLVAILPSFHDINIQ